MHGLKYAEPNQDLIELIKNQYKCKFVPNLIARGKPRMVSADQWWKKNLSSPIKKRRDRAEFLADWYRYVDAVKVCFANVPITSEMIVEARFPVGPNETLKEMQNRHLKYHQMKPDSDNILKGIMDALVKQDQKIGLELCWKVWVNTFEADPGIAIYYK